jgi:hypothetical protein
MPSAYRPRAHISNHGRALLLYRKVYPFFTCGEYLKRRLFWESERKTLFRK